MALPDHEGRPPLARLQPELISRFAMASRFLAPFSTSRGLWGRDPFLQLHRDMNRLFDDTLRDWAAAKTRLAEGLPP